jgi:hypothetical protein
MTVAWKGSHMKTNESEDRLAPVKLIEEAADTVNLLALEMAIQALERNTEGDFSVVDDNFLVKMAERGMNLTGIMGRMMNLSSVM